MPLSILYKLAWFGRPGWGDGDPLYATHWPDLLWETSDSSRFKFEYNLSKAPPRFNFYMSVPQTRANREGLMKTMQAALQNYFGYAASVEIRPMPYWKLTATVEAQKNLTSTHPQSQYHAELEAGGLKGIHIPIDLLVGHLRSYATDHLPIFDETGIKKPIDIAYKAIMIDMGDVQRALKKIGLILEKDTRTMQVLVIRDLASYP